MLDVLTIVSPTTPRQFLQECRQSLAVAANFASFSVRLIESPAVEGHIGAAMRSAIEKASAQFVAFVDDDDFVLPNAFACLARHFERAPSAICAREVQLLQNGRLVPNMLRHHFSAFRLDIARALPLDAPAASMYDCLRFADDRGELIDELSWVYVYRRWLSAGLAVRAAQAKELAHGR